FVSLRAPGVTDIAITGGVLDQNFALYLEEVNAKHVDADGNETRDHATLDATGYAGNVWVTGIDGGNVRHTYKIEIDRGLGVGEKVRIVINGREGVIELKEVTAENGDAIAHFALEGELFDHTSAQRIIGSSDSLPSSIGSEILRDVLWTELFQALPSLGVSTEGSETLEITSYGYPLSIEISAEGDGGSESFKVEEADHYHLVNEISELRLGDGNDSVWVGFDHEENMPCGYVALGDHGDLTHYSHYNLGGGNNILRVGGNIFGTVVILDGNSAVEVGNGIGGDASVSFGTGNGLLVVKGDIFGAASVTFAGGNNMLRGGELDDEEIPYAGKLRGFGSVVFNGEGNNVAYLKGISEYGRIEFNNEGTSALYVDCDIEDNATVSFGYGPNYLAVGGSIWGSGVNVSFGDGVSTANVKGSIGKATVTFGAS